MQLYLLKVWKRYFCKSTLENRRHTPLLRLVDSRLSMLSQAGLT